MALGDVLQASSALKERQIRIRPQLVTLAAAKETRRQFHAWLERGQNTTLTMARTHASYVPGDILVRQKELLSHSRALLAHFGKIILKRR